MSLLDFYPWLKALHVTAVVTFVGSLLATALFLAAWRIDRAESNPAWLAVAKVFRRWDQAVTGPALLIVWILGMSLAVTGDWFSDGWLQAKLVLVIAISALHGLQSTALRRLAAGEDPGSSSILRIAAPLALSFVATIAILVVVKPF